MEFFLSTEKEEFPTLEEYDPSHPTVVFNLSKWYLEPEDIAKLLIDQYPHFKFVV